MRGYAYCGGGRRVHRAEISLDDGQVRFGCVYVHTTPHTPYTCRPLPTYAHAQTWELAELSPEEYPTEHGRFWCWRLWTFDVDVLRLVSCKNVAVRAWDDSQNTQPRDLTWNVLGSE